MPCAVEAEDVDAATTAGTCWEPGKSSIISTSSLRALGRALGPYATEGAESEAPGGTPQPRSPPGWNATGGCVVAAASVRSQYAASSWSEILVTAAGVIVAAASAAALPPGLRLSQVHR